jgi:hypothetical protein
MILNEKSPYIGTSIKSIKAAAESLTILTIQGDLLSDGE